MLALYLELRVDRIIITINGGVVKPGCEPGATPPSPRAEFRI